MSKVFQTVYARGVGIVCYVDGAHDGAAMLRQGGPELDREASWKVVRAQLFEHHTGLVLDPIDVALFSTPAAGDCTLHQDHP